MKSQTYLLKAGTKVKTHLKLEDIKGMLISPLNLNLRKPNTIGIIKNYVPGHGGDVYWVQHENDDRPAAYCFTEFDIVHTIKEN